MNTQELRELDAWITEHVMGLYPMNFDNEHDKFNFFSKTKERADKIRKHGHISGNRIIDNFPHYTSDPAAALEVLKKCKDTCIQNKINQADEWCVGTLAGDLFATADTLELAIAKFSLALFSKK